MMRRVLLVDDDPLAQDLVRAILQTAGYETDIAPDGFAALKLLRAYSYRIVLVDYHLPEMDGYVLAKLLNDVAGANRTPLRLVGITADRNGLAARRGADALFQAIVVKPFGPQSLIDLVKDAFLASVERIDDVKDAAAALLAEPGIDRARSAATAFWRGKGLASLPMIFPLPEPTAEEARDLSICFDLVNEDAAELIILQNVGCLHALSHIKERRGNNLPPVVTLDQSLASISDTYFHVADIESWGDVAERLIGYRTANRVTETLNAFLASPKTRCITTLG